MNFEEEPAELPTIFASCWRQESSMATEEFERQAPRMICGRSKRITDGG